MSVYNGRDYLFVIWKDADTGSRIEIGKLSKNGVYEFKYNKNGVKKAKKKGFKELITFPNVDNVYTNNQMFPIFSLRLPDKRRKDIAKILKEYKLESYDSFELLRKSKGKLPTDSLEFIDPIFNDESKDITRTFYIAGTRYSKLCNPSTSDFPECNINLKIEIDESLNLKSEKDNNFDSNAVIILKNSEKIGYIPRYYSEPVSEAMAKGQTIECKVIEFNRKNCQECLKVKLTIKKSN